MALQTSGRINMNPISPLYSLALKWEKENGKLFSGETLEMYDGFFVKHMVPFFGGKVEIDGQEVRAFIEKKKEEGLSEHSIYTMRRLLARVLEYGAAMGECPAPEWDLGLGVPKARKGATILSVEQQTRLERFLVDHPTPKHLCLFLMLTTGIGPGEVTELKWEDVQLHAGQIRVRTQRGTVSTRKASYRQVPIGERQKIYLRKMESLPTVYLWTGKPKQMTAAGLRDRLLKVLDELILPPLRLSDLRHTYGVRRLEAGITYKQLTRELGLSDARDVRRYYGALLPPPVRAAREKEYADDFQPPKRPAHIAHPGPDASPEVVAIRRKIEARKKELQYVLDNLEFDLDIVNTLRNADGVQGKAREGLYQFVEKVLGPDDKDGQCLVEYMRCNMRVASMPLRVNRQASVQTIRSRVSRGFAKLCRRLDELNAIKKPDSRGNGSPEKKHR